MADNAALPSIDAYALAAVLGVSPKEVYDLTKAGVIERGLGRLYSVEDSVRRYCDHLRQRANSSAINPVSQVDTEPLRLVSVNDT